MIQKANDGPQFLERNGFIEAIPPDVARTAREYSDQKRFERNCRRIGWAFLALGVVVFAVFILAVANGWSPV